MESWLQRDNLTDFCCWLFIVLNIMFNFSIFILPIQLKHYSVLVMLKKWISLSPKIFSPELFENLKQWNFSGDLENKNADFYQEIMIF